MTATFPCRAGAARPELTAREVEVLIAWLASDSKREVTERLFLADSTVRRTGTSAWAISRRAARGGVGAVAGQGISLPGPARGSLERLLTQRPSCHGDTVAEKTVVHRR